MQPLPPQSSSATPATARPADMQRAGESWDCETQAATSSSCYVVKICYLFGYNAEFPMWLPTWGVCGKTSSMSLNREDTSDMHERGVQPRAVAFILSFSVFLGSRLLIKLASTAAETGRCRNFNSTQMALFGMLRLPSSIRWLTSSPCGAAIASVVRNRSLPYVRVGGGLTRVRLMDQNRRIGHGSAAQQCLAKCLILFLVLELHQKRVVLAPCREHIIRADNILAWRVDHHDR